MAHSLVQPSFRQSLLACLFFVSVVAILYVMICMSLPGPTETTGRFANQQQLRLPSRAFEEVSKTWPELDHLVIVPGHAIQWCTELGRDVNDERCWYLLDYQKGQVGAFLEHIKRASLIAKKSTTLLVFSGGQTRSGMGPRSEAQSYFAVAERLGLLTGTVLDRTVTEEFARDSLENLLFSLCRFRQITGKLPAKVTVIGFPFKARRFIDLHRQAVQIDIRDFEYVSIPAQDNGTVQDAYEDFRTDLFGCGEKLARKRAARNPYHQQHGYSESCPELRSLLTKCPL